MTKIIAHRGFSGSYPENTMLAFQKAVEAGCDGIELDVHLSKDGEVVIIHDEHFQRVTGGRIGEVRNFTLSELSQIDVSNGHPAAYGFTPIPSLKEYFTYVKEQRIFTNIELKNTIVEYPGLEEKVIKLIYEYGLEERVLLSSFNHQSMVKSKKLSPITKCAFLVACHMCDAGAYARRYGVDYINPLFTFVNDQNMAEMGRNGIEVQAWTVNEEEDMKSMLSHNVFAIITNYPDKLRKLIYEQI